MHRSVPGHSRSWRIILAAAAITTGVLIGPARASTACSVRDGARYSPTLQAAIDLAGPGDTLTVRGPCSGPVYVAKSLTIDGSRTSSMPRTLTVGSGHVVVRGVDAAMRVDVIGGARVLLQGSRVGPVSTSGTVKIVNSSVACVVNVGTTKVFRSTVLGGCRADQYSELYGVDNSGTMSIVDSTITGVYRTYNFGGSGIHNKGTLRVVSSTVARNSDYEGGADALVNEPGGKVRLTATILAGEYTDLACQGTVLSGGYNIISNVTGPVAACDFHALSTDQVGSVPTPGNIWPKLATLGSYGGPTATMPLKSGSPALDTIPVGAMSGLLALCPASGPRDQRGVVRPQGPACDTGAVEGGP